MSGGKGGGGGGVGIAIAAPFSTSRRSLSSVNSNEAHCHRGKLSECSGNRSRQSDAHDTIVTSMYTYIMHF